ncbi:MAG: hypothetical protein IJA85_08660 [Clostridia bacterium]|nr:hypothetical protein [Clostridia bacterium]
MNNKLTSRTSISHLTLPRTGYMEALLNTALQYHLIDESAITALQAAIVDQLGVCIKGYTKEESSSVSIETAGELSAGLAYTLNEYLHSLSDHDKALAMLKSRPLNEIWLDGIRLTKSKCAKAMYLSRAAAASRCIIPSASYNRALDSAIRENIIGYDLNYRPHITGRRFDYPTALDAKLEGRGIDFIINYLSALICENHFCNRYPRTLLIRFYDNCRENEPYNFYTPLLLNTVILRFLRRDEGTPFLSPTDVNLAEELLSAFGNDEISSILHHACDSIESENTDYRRRVLDEHLKRIITAVRSRSLSNLLVIS